MWKTLVRSLLVALLALPVMSWSGCNMPAKGSKMEQCEFNWIDRNNDGEVTRTEYMEYTADRFRNCDADNDGKVEKDEFVEFMVERHHAKDINKDGLVNHTEIVAASSGEVFEAEFEEVEFPEGDKTSHFEMVDLNDDGVITSEEYAIESSRWVRVADQDNDGKRSVEEVEAHMGWLFDKIDDDGDGIVEEDEMMENYVGDEDK